MTRVLRSGVVLCVALMGVTTRAAHAQMATTAQRISLLPAPPNMAQSSLGPTAVSLSVGVQASVPQASTSFVPAASRTGERQSVALMIVGGASVLVGAVIEGKPGAVFMIGGAVIGLYGLYKYLE